MSPSKPFGKPDIAIAGGGPAGAIAAILLNRAGARVTIVDAGARSRWVEGAGLRLVAALKAQRLAVEGVGPLLERRVAWGDLSGAPNREHMLSRPVFDEGLRQQAEAEGVRVLRGTITAVAHGVIATADGSMIDAGLVFEARGRRASVGAERRRGIPTVSIAGHSGPRPPGSDIAAWREGWIWSIGAGSEGWTQITLDASDARDPAAAWARMTGGVLPQGALVRGSELRLSAPHLDPALPRLGDAAVAMDPLSGHGLFWALGSALTAVPIADALLAGHKDLAARFYKSRVAATFERQARVGRDFYRASGIAAPFWERRGAWPDDIAAEPAAPDAPRLERRVVVRAGRLAETDVLVTRQEPEGAAFVGGFEIAPLLARLGGASIPDRAAFADQILPEAPPETAGRIYDWLAERGVTTAPVLQQKEVHS